MNDETKFFFEQTRDHIKHEDDLINHRMTWLVALQSFLFGAYGFSLAAESNLVAAANKGTAEATQSALDALPAMATIAKAREGLALMGVLSSFLIFFALLAAALAIHNFVARWKRHPGYAETFPAIIGYLSSRTTKSGSLILGLVPALTLPLACIFVWGFLEGTRFAVFTSMKAAILLLGAGAFVYLGFRIGIKSRT